MHCEEWLDVHEQRAGVLLCKRRESSFEFALSAGFDYDNPLPSLSAASCAFAHLTWHSDRMGGPETEQIGLRHQLVQQPHLFGRKSVACEHPE
jgi:hypothetical protein